ncbi:hypothetical protein ACQPU1_07340 [Clostridium paraputrificum]|uniref:hypothetical protein n=1 Tax=Clostridium paraputrificum TaxID=29363 RepID=UPI003D345450
MFNLIHAELFKLRKSAGLKVGLIASTLCAIGLAMISHNIAIGTIGEEVIANASGLSEVMMISLLGSLMAGILVCSDFETKTIHDSVACGNGRGNIVFSKFLVYVLIIGMLMIPYIIVTLIGFSTSTEFAKSFNVSVFANIMSESSTIGVSAESIGKIISISLVEILVYVARLSICILIAFKARKTMVVMGIGFTLSGLVDLLIGLVDDIPGVSKIISMTPFYREYMLINMDTEVGTLLKIALISIVFILVIALITYKLFKRAEIK